MDLDFDIWSCSPNTRRRRKAEQEEQAAQLMQWKNDTTLLKKVLKQTERNVIEPPCPTQKPRPISSRLVTSPTNSTASGSSSSDRPRKRRATAAQRARASRSSASTPDSGSEKIDALLAQFALAQVSMSMSNSNSPSIDDSPLKSMSTNINGVASSITAPSPLRKSTSGFSDWSKTGSSSSGGHASRSISRNPSSSSVVRTASTVTATSTIMRTGSDQDQGGSIRRPNPPPRSAISPTSSRTPLSPTKQSCPRIGLRSSQSMAGSTSRRPDLSKQFKPPLINPPTRSSPRRQAPPRAAQQAVMKTPTSNRSRGNTAISNDSVPRLPPIKRGKEPSSDGPTTGDESFDSFDGMFENGGEDVERLLSMVDGSK